MSHLPSIRLLLAALPLLYTVALFVTLGKFMPLSFVKQTTVRQDKIIHDAKARLIYGHIHMAKTGGTSRKFLCFSDFIFPDATDSFATSITISKRHVGK